MTARIAIVEDNPDNRLLLRALLQPTYEVTEYANGPAALQGFGDHKPDVVLLDISLPGMDGVEVLARLRAHPQLKAVPVVALTAHAMAEDRARFLAQGFDAYIAKPITDETVLLEAIERLVGASGGSKT